MTQTNALWERLQTRFGAARHERVITSYSIHYTKLYETVVSVAEDALDTVPRSYREGAWAIGATKWQTIWRVTLPAASSGVLTAVMLGIGRAIGETMAVMMVTGNAPVMALKLSSYNFV